MRGLNRYYRGAHISERDFRRVVRCFALDLTATDTAALVGLSRRATNTLYLKLRARLARWCEATAPFQGTVEIDESYFGPRRVRGKHGRGAGRKTVVFGIYLRNGFAYTQILPDIRRATLRAILTGRVALESVVHSDTYTGYDGLVDLGYAKHYRVAHSTHEFATREGAPRRHINGIESFWSYAKRRLAKFNGVPRRTFYLHLKETEFRFNLRRQNLYQELLARLRQQPL